MNPDIVEAVAEHAAGKRTNNVSRLCREHSISRNTFHVLSRKFQAEGAAAFTTRSTRPATSPTRTSTGIADAIVRARKELDDEGLDNGPISIGWRLELDRMATGKRGTATSSLQIDDPPGTPRSSKFGSLGT